LKPIIIMVNMALIMMNTQEIIETMPPHRRASSDGREVAGSASPEAFSRRSKAGLILTVPSSLVST